MKHYQVAFFEFTPDGGVTILGVQVYANSKEEACVKAQRLCEAEGRKVSLAPNMPGVENCIEIR